MNKGTHALVTSEIDVMRRALGCIDVTVSTEDVDSLARLEPQLRAVPTILDIPFLKADALSTRLHKDRRSMTYKLLALGWTVVVLLEVPLSLLSSMIAKLVKRPFYRGRTIKSLQEASLVVSTGDENFKEGYIFLPYNLAWKLASWSMLFSRMWDVIIAKRIFGKRIVVFPNSVGPFRTLLGRTMAKIILSNVDYIFLREEHSLENIASLKIATPAQVVCDIALLLEEMPRMENQVHTKPLLGISPGLYDATFGFEDRLRLIRAYAGAIDALVEKHGFEVIFLPHEITGLPYDDLDFSKAITGEMRYGQEGKIVSVKSLSEFREQLAHLDMLVTSRFHPAVLAFASRVPTVSIMYDHKQSGFLTIFGLQWCGIAVSEMTKERSVALAESVWNKKDEIRNTLERKVPKLQQETFEHIRNTMLSLLDRPTGFGQGSDM